MSNSPPSTLGKYQIIREIARSNDIVYEAYDPLMNRRVAIKELAMPRGATTPQLEDRISRFRREAQAVGALAHPNIMTVYEYGQEGDRHFMAMEYLDGQTLRSEIDTKGFLTPERTVEIAKAVLNGLSHAHGKGVIHRDIKPDNIQILSNGEIKITDFGIARLTFQPNLTMDGQVFGTPSYMSPEQVVGKEIDARSDLFSVGVLLYEMLSGKKPFQGDNVVTITHAIMNREPDPLTTVPWGLQAVVKKALEKTPSLRFGSAQDMSKALDEGLVAGKSPDPPTVANPWGGPLPGYQPSPAPTPMPAPPPIYNYNQPQYGSAGYPAAPPPYDPYAAAGGPAAPPHTPAYGNPYNPYPPTVPMGPVPYIPPPRQPLFKPETRATMGRFLVALLILGTLVGAVLIGISILANQPTAQASPGSPASSGSVPARTAPRQVEVDVGAPGIPQRPAASATEPVPDYVPTVSEDTIRRAFDMLRQQSPVPGSVERQTAYALLDQVPPGSPLRDEIIRYIEGE